jgi:hypothetical protein
MEKFNHFENREPENQENKNDLIWKNKLEEIEKITDRIGTPIDKNVKEAVAAFQLNGFTTATSCEGHIEKGAPAPWIVVEALNKPTERFVNEKQIFQKKASEYNIPIEKFDHHTDRKAFLEAFTEAAEQGETEEYRNWRKENEKLRLKMTGYLDEFYKDKTVPDDIRLTIETFFTDAFCVHNGGEEYGKNQTNWIEGIENTMTEEEVNELEKKMEDRRQEMNKFAEFLKNKYFSEK